MTAQQREALRALTLAELAEKLQRILKLSEGVALEVRTSPQDEEAEHWTTEVWFKHSPDAPEEDGRNQQRAASLGELLLAIRDTEGGKEQ